MEAVGKHNFNATADDELSFGKGDVIKILDMEEDKNWFRAELRGNEGFIPANYIKLKENPWYHGKMTRQQSESMLLERQAAHCIQPDGAFILRPSETGRTPGDFSLSVKWGDGVQHFKILRDTKNGKYFLWIVKFHSINELIEYHKTSSVSRSQTIYLKHMVSKAQNLGRVQALFDFNAEEDGEITFRKGDVLLVLEKPDPNWWMGVLESNQSTKGLFPSTYVRAI